MLKVQRSSGCRVQGFGVKGLGFGIFGVKGLGCRVKGAFKKRRVWGVGSRFPGVGPKPQ